jgi:hypothetical protein
MKRSATDRIAAIVSMIVATAFVALAVATWPSGGSSSAQPAGVEPRDSHASRLKAVADGKTDATTALQQAVDSAIGPIRLPEGIFRITKPIVVDLEKRGYTSISGDGVARIDMAGPGPALKFVGTHFKSADPDGFERQVWDRERMPLVDGLAIVGAHPQAVGIEAVGTMQLTITRVHVREALHAIHLVRHNRNVVVADCHLYENRGIGIYYDDVDLHQSNITGCHISYNAGGGIVSRGGNVRNIHITGCDIESNMSRQSPPTANVLIDSAGSQYGTGEVAITGCTIQHNNPSPDSANIRILGRSAPARPLKNGTGSEQRVRKPDKNGDVSVPVPIFQPDGNIVREGNVTITGNVLSDVKVNLHLKDCRGVAITGNTFWMGYEHDLLIEDCSNIVVGPNNFDRNPRYAYGNTAEANNGVVIRGSVDCTLMGLHITGVYRKMAGLLIEDCRRFNVTGCTILNCDNVGLLVKNLHDSRISGCLIRDDRPQAKSASLQAIGGGGNMIVDNLLGSAARIADNLGLVKDNVVNAGGSNR